MRWSILGWVVGWVLAPLVVGAQTTAEAERAQTAAFVAAHQNPDGGFAASPGEASSLGATSSAIRVLKYTGGQIPDPTACAGFVRSCFDREAGGFAPTPGGTPDVRTTAVGLMAAVALDQPTERIRDRVIAYFSRHVESFDDIRIAVAGLEAIGTPSPDFPRWIAQVRADQNPDGTFGQGAGQARATGSAVAALLRMGVELEGEEKRNIVQALKDGQRPDGGWARGESDDEPSDLETTYRVMRSLYMLREAPDLETLQSFIASCRHDNGGYGVTPGAEANLGGTYFAITTLGWVRELGAGDGEEVGFEPLFNGTDLTGWEGNTELWSARDGMIVGKSPGIHHNDFLASEERFDDFILRFSFRLVDGEGNSGVQFRSDRLEGHEMIGYQADIGEGYWGSLYDESRRNRVLQHAREDAVAALDKAGWNDYEIHAQGDHIVLKLNGVVSVDYREPDPDIARDGVFGLQIHSGGPMEIQFKDIRVKRLSE